MVRAWVGVRLRVGVRERPAWRPAPSRRESREILSPGCRKTVGAVGATVGTVGPCRTTVGLSDCRTVGALSEPCRTLSDTVGWSLTVKGCTPCRTLSDTVGLSELSELSELSDCRTPVGHLSDTVGPLSEPLVHNTPRAPTLSLTLSSSWRRRPSPSWHPSCSGCRLLPVSNNRLLPVRGAQVPCVVAALAVRQSGVQRTVRLVERGMLAPKEGQKVVHEVQSICCDSIFG